MKEETFLELAIKYYPSYPDGIITDEIRALREGFVKGCEVQSDRIYSEEEVRQMFNRYNEIIAHRDIEEWQPWIEKQFKKK